VRKKEYLESCRENFRGHGFRHFKNKVFGENFRITLNDSLDAVLQVSVVQRRASIDALLRVGFCDARVEQAYREISGIEDIYTCETTAISLFGFRQDYYGVHDAVSARSSLATIFRDVGAFVSDARSSPPGLGRLLEMLLSNRWGLRVYWKAPIVAALHEGREAAESLLSRFQRRAGIDAIPPKEEYGRYCTAFRAWLDARSAAPMA
jgi:hypothetical protein